jgi:hypothetical protein
MKELIKPMPIEKDYSLMTFLDETCNQGCNRVCCETVTGGCRDNPNRSSEEDCDIIF